MVLNWLIVVLGKNKSKSLQTKFDVCIFKDFRVMLGYIPTKIRNAWSKHRWGIFGYLAILNIKYYLKKFFSPNFLIKKAPLIKFQGLKQIVRFTLARLDIRVIMAKGGALTRLSMKMHLSRLFVIFQSTHQIFTLLIWARAKAVRFFWLLKPVLAR